MRTKNRCDTFIVGLYLLCKKETCWDMRRYFNGTQSRVEFCTVVSIRIGKFTNIRKNWKTERRFSHYNQRLRLVLGIFIQGWTLSVPPNFRFYMQWVFYYFLLIRITLFVQCLSCDMRRIFNWLIGCTMD